jgi:hypothetical protein
MLKEWDKARSALTGYVATLEQAVAIAKQG